MAKTEAYIKKPQVCGHIYVTTNYSMFKLIESNRDIKDPKVKSIAQGIEEAGWRNEPIVVNKNYEIIDGQHRFFACKMLGLPIHYVIDADATAEDCRVLNRNQSNWNVRDYINSYAAEGNANYVNFKRLQSQFPQITINAIFYAISDAAQVPKSIVDNGLLECSNKQYDEAMPSLIFLDNLIPLLKEIRGRIDYMSVAIIFIAKHEKSCNLKRLEKVVKDNYLRMLPVGDVNAALKELERLYNHNCKSTLMNFANDYIQYSNQLNRGKKHHSKKKR